MARLFAPFRNHPGTGGIITYEGTAPGQLVIWELVSYDPATELEGVALGSLLFTTTVTDKASRATNAYFSPAADPGDGTYDRVKVTATDV